MYGTFLQHCEAVCAGIDESDERIERYAKVIVASVAVSAVTATLGILVSLKLGWIWGLVFFPALLVGETVGLVVSRVILRRTRAFHQERQEFLQEMRSGTGTLRCE